MDLRLQNQKIHIFFFRVFAAILYILPIFSILPDRLIRKNGEFSNGKALNFYPTLVEWKDESGKVTKIPLSEVERIDVGYDGIPICAKLPNAKEISCELLLHKFSKSMVSVTSKKSPLKLDTYPVNRNLEMKFDFTQVEVDYSRHIRPGVFGKWEAGTFVGRANLVSNVNGSWVLLPEGKGAVPLTFNLQDMKNFQLDHGPSVKDFVIENTPKVIPGYSALNQKKYNKSLFLFGSAVLSGFGMIYEYDQSVKAINEDREFLPTPDGRVFVVSNVFSNDRYDFHNQRFQAYTAIFSLIVIYSLIDSFYLGQIESKTGNTSSVWIRPEIGATAISKDKAYTYLPLSYNPLHYSFEVEARF